MRPSGTWSCAVAACLVSFIAIAPPSLAQITNGTVSGSVKDNSAAVIPGATVTLASATRGTSQETRRPVSADINGWQLSGVYRAGFGTNYLTQAPQNVLDLSVSRLITIGGSRRLELCVDAFNTVNFTTVRHPAGAQSHRSDAGQPGERCRWECRESDGVRRRQRCCAGA
jgi:hypothetical protein